MSTEEQTPNGETREQLAVIVQVWTGCLLGFIHLFGAERQGLGYRKRRGC